MKRIIITININNNAVMREDPVGETRKILQSVTDTVKEYIECGNYEKGLVDTNGNVVGKFSIQRVKGE